MFSTLFTIFTLLSTTRWVHALGRPHLHQVHSKVAPGAVLSYKQTNICETTPGVRAFSGYIHMPSLFSADVGGATSYNTSIFFWYIESRKNPSDAPLALYLGGGPGYTSLAGVTEENGPCTINPDSNSTTRNIWSWNNHVNMLYIDQPVSVGFSYSEPVASTVDQLTGLISPINGNVEAVQRNATFVKGLLASQDIDAFPNTTANAAKILWEFAQIWLQEFPEHRSCDDRVSIWTNSYGGHWGPVTMAHFESQNRKIRNGTLSSPIRNATGIHLDTLGITNGCIDAKIEAATYLQMAVNNTYGLKTITEEDYQSALNDLTKVGGCNDLIDHCRALALADPENTGTNATINTACAAATQFCFEYVQGVYTATSGRNAFDISRPPLSIFPPYYTVGFMNQEWVRKDLGALVNFTVANNNVANVFLGETGDVAIVSIDTINYVAQSGIKVALVFGDRDYRCNWLGGEAISLAMEHESSSKFREAGYARITTNSTYQGGVVRQNDGISFSRVFDAGHAAGAYQPETVSRIFDRVMLDKDVATGKINIRDAQYSSKGPESSFRIKNVLPPAPKNECYTWAITDTCTTEQIAALANGTATVRDYIVREP